ncbi:hypothetical protein JM79_2742 [Gramella sp. Hel_I_59]|uniref:hypothetical protein n=1 Tax=Gramella sp. Hel_I_59 TaxID=1249978 RepID=UPI0011504712|nr:hypothetical protein [Gramella sp. Hel_I_59]TQI71793.1 hypothetical protein JM79_2742 [Gramella sp. Hel_I_59]
MIRDSKISIKGISQDEVKMLSDACKLYQDYLELLCNTENRCQHHIHHSINREYGYMLLAKITRRNIPMSNTINIDVHVAFIVSDGLRYYIDSTQDIWGKNAAIKLLDEIFQELPHSRDIDKYSLISESNN